MLSYDGMNYQPVHLANNLSHPPNFHLSEVCFWAARAVSWTVGWGIVSGWLGCGMPRTPRPSITTPQ